MRSSLPAAPRLSKRGTARSASPELPVSRPSQPAPGIHARTRGSAQNEPLAVVTALTCHAGRSQKPRCDRVLTHSVFVVAVQHREFFMRHFYHLVAIALGYSRAA